jgi:hypothetical protein
MAADRNEKYALQGARQYSVLLLLQPLVGFCVGFHDYGCL